MHGHSRNLILHPATVPEMEVKLLDPMDLKKFFQEKSFVYQKQDILSGHIQTSLDLTNVQALKMSEVFLHFKKNIFGKINVVSELHCCYRSSMQTVSVKKIADDKYSLSFSPKTRGQHELHIKYNDMHICGSPIPVYVTIHPDQIMAASKPQITALHDAAGIKCHENMLFVCKLGKSIVILDSSTKSKQMIITVPGIGEIVIDGTYIYATDIEEHRLIKMDMGGTIIKATGRKGDNPGEFDFPNGIQLSKDDEIYVCDTRNNRYLIKT